MLHHIMQSFPSRSNACFSHLLLETRIRMSSPLLIPDMARKTIVGSYGNNEITNAFGLILLASKSSEAQTFQTVLRPWTTACFGALGVFFIGFAAVLVTLRQPIPLQRMFLQRHHGIHKEQLGLRNTQSAISCYNVSSARFVMFSL